jgi:hypothetical protein
MLDEGVRPACYQRMGTISRSAARLGSLLVVTGAILAFGASLRPTLPSAAPFEPNTSVLLNGLLQASLICQSNLPTITWSPTRDEVLEADQAFAAILEPGSVSRPTKPSDIEALQEAAGNSLLMLGSSGMGGPRLRARDYYRQFSGVYLLNGQKTICILATHGDVLRDDKWWRVVHWRRWPVVMIDGGALQIHARYNLTTKSISGFRPNDSP